MRGPPGDATHTGVDVNVVTLTLGRVAEAGDNPRLQVWLTTDPAGQDRWALPGAALTPTVDLEGATRAVLADIGVNDPRHLEQLASFGAPERTPGRHSVSVTYLALIPQPHEGHGGQWAPLEQGSVPVAMAWDHGLIVDTAVQRVRSKLSYSNIAFGLLPDEFTMSELQAVYEAVWDTTLDKRNFRRKVGTLGLLAPTGGQRRGSHRPARLYTFVSSELVLLDDVIATS
ncbi:MAG: NUDIX hydrolase [Euzebya sp.]